MILQTRLCYWLAHHEDTEGSILCTRIKYGTTSEWDIRCPGSHGELYTKFSGRAASERGVGLVMHKERNVSAFYYYTTKNSCELGIFFQQNYSAIRLRKCEGLLIGICDRILWLNDWDTILLKVNPSSGKREKWEPINVQTLLGWCNVIKSDGDNSFVRTKIYQTIGIFHSTTITGNQSSKPVLEWSR